MEFDSTFWVAISFVIFFGVLIYFKIPRKINEALDTKISEIFASKAPFIFLGILK